MSQTHKVSFVSLGCPKALVDSEHIVTALQDAGYEIVGEDDDAQVVVVNTCGFIDAAKQESIDTIAQAYDQERKVVVTGCMGQADSELLSQFENLEFISGPAQVAPVVKGVSQYLPNAKPLATDASLSLDAQTYSLHPDSGARTRLTPDHYAYLKVSEGCNHSCSFCIIPDMRGKLRSRDIDDVLTEAAQLVDDGVKELLVVAQDLSAYGLDIKYRSTSFQNRSLQARLQVLCEELGQIAPWVRLHYVYPYPHVDQIIPLMAQGLILPYLDMPLQHASTRLLKDMRRPAAMEKTLERIQRWRNECPELVIRSTFIVGFPGETDEDVGILLDFLEAAQLDRVGCFTYSPVEGAQANQLPDHVDESDKLDRQEVVYEIQAGISSARLAARRGQVMRVLVDEVSTPRAALGRTVADAPEIDGTVHVTHESPGALQTGEFVWVHIDDSDDHDLYGHVVGDAVKIS